MGGKLKFIPDTEISLYKGDFGAESNDMLNTLPYVDALEQCINRVPGDDAFTIGLYGEWGSGKSSILKTLEDRLEKGKDNDYKFVKYDAWKYSQDSFRRMFLLELQEQLGVQRSDKMERFYDNINEDIEINRNVNWAYFVSVVAIFVIIVSLVIWLVSSTCFSESTKATGISISTIVAIFSVLAVFFKHSADEMKVTVQKSRLFAPEQFEECYKEIVESAFNPSLARRIWTKVTGGKPCKKIIVIIDNIDRCSAQQAQELLTTIKTFMGKDNVIFIIPVAVNALINHIVKSSNGEADSKEANEYLRKFFNVALWIKPFQNDEMYDFTSHLVTKYGLKLNPTSISIISREYATNPRRIIQLLNNFIEESSLYDKDFLKDNESLICILLIMREEFPDYYAKLIEPPNYLLYEPNKDNSSTDLIVFWKRTKVTILSYRDKIHTIDKIISNSSVFNNLPNEVVTALETADIDRIKDYIKKNPQSKQPVVDCLKDKVNKAITRDIPNEVVNLMQIVCTMQKEGILDDYDDTLLANLFDNNYNWGPVISYFEGQDDRSLIDFAILLYNKHYSHLLDSIINNWQDLISLGKTNVISKNIFKGIYYYCSVVDHTLIRADVLALFIDAYKILPQLCFDFKYKEPVLLFNDKFFTELFNRAKNEDIMLDLGIDWQIQQISKQLEFEEAPFNQYVGILTDKMPGYDVNNKNAKQLLTYIEALSDLMETYKDEQVDDNTELKKFIEKVFHTTSTKTNTYPPKTVLRNIVLDNEKDNDLLSILIKFIGLSFFMAGEAIINQDLISELMDCEEETQDKLVQILVELKDKGIDISNYGKAILKYHQYSNIYFNLLEYLFGNDSDGNLRLNTEDVKSELSKILIHSKTAVDKKPLENFVNKVVTNSNVMTIFLDIVSKYSNEELLKLPKSIQALAVNKLEKNIDVFKNNIGVLSIIAKAGSKSAIVKLVDIITGKLVDKNSVNDAVSLILQLHYCNDRSRKQLISILENQDGKGIDKETCNKCIDYLKSLK